MAFAIAGLARGGVTIADEQVVSKSYPRFWKTLDEVGSSHRRSGTDDDIIRRAPADGHGWYLVPGASSSSLANGFFVAAEFGIVKVRSTQLAELAEEGSVRARMARRLTKRLDAYLSATQLGITLASLALGWIGEPAFERLIEPLFVRFGTAGAQYAHSVAATVAFAIISMLHIVLGELAPKSIAIQKPVGTALWVAHLLHGFYIVTFPAIWLLNSISRACFA